MERACKNNVLYGFVMIIFLHGSSYIYPFCIFCGAVDRVEGERFCIAGPIDWCTANLFHGCCICCFEAWRHCGNLGTLRLRWRLRHCQGALNRVVGMPNKSSTQLCPMSDVFGISTEFEKENMFHVVHEKQNVTQNGLFSGPAFGDSMHSGLEVQKVGSSACAADVMFNNVSGCQKQRTCLRYWSTAVMSQHFLPRQFACSAKTTLKTAWNWSWGNACRLLLQHLQLCGKMVQCTPGAFHTREVTAPPCRTGLAQSSDKGNAPKSDFQLMYYVSLRFRVRDEIGAPVLQCFWVL